MIKKSAVLLLSAVFFIPVLNAQSATMKVGVLNVQYAINESNEGKKIKKIIETEVEQTRNELLKKKQEVDAVYNELQTSVILTEDARKQKEQQVQQMVRELQNKQTQQEELFRNKERQSTERLISEITKVAEDYGKKNNYDFIIEAQLASGILFSKYKFEDITKQIIDIYNKTGKPTTTTVKKK